MYVGTSNQPPVSLPPGVSAHGEQLAQLAQRPQSALPQLAPTTGTSLKLLVDEPQMAPAMLESIRGARKQIDLAMFSLSDSGLGREVVDALIERAKSGVAVYVTLDAVGSSTMLPVGSTKQMLERMRAAGINVGINERVSGGRLQPVDHRKLLVIDGERAFTGGANFSKKFGKWHDIMVQMDGPAARQFAAHFLDRWVDVTGHATAGQRALVAGGGSPTRPMLAAEDARAGVSMLSNHPRVERHATDHLHASLTHARERAWMLTPTLSDPDMIEALTSAARRGVDTRVAVSGPQGWIGTKALRLIGATYYRDLVNAGVKVYEQPGMSHAKAWLIDDVASAGSLNLTRRALLWDHELMMATTDARLSAELASLMQRDFAASTLVTTERANSLGMKAGELLRRATRLRW
jgi:phosphatidylserine/phosphatidylglycerophosphate/cardiolipin synthase-like enzyme